MHMYNHSLVPRPLLEKLSFSKGLEYGNGLHILHSYTACVKSPVIPHLLQGDLIIGYVPYIGAIDMQINQIPTLPQYSPYRG